MTMSLSKPTYIPRNKRKRLPNNTVYSVGDEDGWKPSSASSSQNQPLCAQDLMDDRDFEEWGGSSGLQKEFATNTTTADSKRSSDNVLMDLFSVRLPTRVGDKLLAKLGWRAATGSSFVPSEDTTRIQDTSSASLQLLSKRKLKRIQNQQQRVRIPKPKLDTAGLGFDPHRNAPEFHAYKQRMQKRKTQNVYKVDTVLGRTSSKATASPSQDESDTFHDPSYLAPEDFVGTKSAAGFALHDDDDDQVFDNEQETRRNISDKIKLDADDYDMVAYEASDSSDDETNQAKPGGGTLKSDAVASLFGDALSSWAAVDGSTGGEMSNNNTSGAPVLAAVTADGRPPLAGFVLGGSSAVDSNRFRGPDVPAGYEPTRHVFSSNEDPSVLQALSYAVKLEAADKRQEHAMDQARIVAAPQQQASNPSTTAIMTTFSGLSKTMNARFTTGGGEAEAVGTKDVEAPLASEIQVKRTVQSFYPQPLLCKRFNLPALPRPTQPLDPGLALSREQTFFRDEIMTRVDTQQASVAKKPSTTRAIDRNPMDSVETDPLLLVERPSMDLFKSIFMADSDDDLSSDDEKDAPVIDSQVAKSGDQMVIHMNSTSTHAQEQPVIQSEASQSHQIQHTETLVPYKESKRSRKSYDEKGSVDAHSTDLSATSSDDNSRLARKRRKKEAKQKKKHKKKKSKKKKTTN
jgi:hypothetical protein